MSYRIVWRLDPSAVEHWGVGIELDAVSSEFRRAKDTVSRADKCGGYVKLVKGDQTIETWVNALPWWTITYYDCGDYCWTYTVKQGRYGEGHKQVEVQAISRADALRQVIYRPGWGTV